MTYEDTVQQISYLLLSDLASLISSFMALNRLPFTGGGVGSLIYLAIELPYKVNKALEFSHSLDIHMASPSPAKRKTQLRKQSAQIKSEKRT